MKAIARREVDMIATWAVDRLGHSLQNIIAFLTEINSKGVDFYLHQQALDTSIPIELGERSIRAAFRQNAFHQL